MFSHLRRPYTDTTFGVRAAFNYLVVGQFIVCSSCPWMKSSHLHVYAIPTRKTQRADLIRNADLIIWDELPMTHRYCGEALERSLRHIARENKLFGGKTMFFFPVNGIKSDL